MNIKAMEYKVSFNTPTFLGNAEQQAQFELLGTRAVGWLETEIQEWLEQRIESSRSEDNGRVGNSGGNRHFSN